MLLADCRIDETSRLSDHIVVPTFIAAKGLLTSFGAMSVVEEHADPKRTPEQMAMLAFIIAAAKAAHAEVTGLEVSLNCTASHGNVNVASHGAASSSNLLRAGPV